MRRRKSGRGTSTQSANTAIGYGDVLPTTTLGRINTVLLGLTGLLMTRLAAVRGVQEAARRAGVEIGASWNS
ncbi:ion channel [Paraburkholderia hospita]|uniref:ion channel n=1 Tax=Paraburkholderia hospita TaxID=169430 RepID=UPI000B80352D